MPTIMTLNNPKNGRPHDPSGTHTRNEYIKVEVATEEELLAFANKVREAGGASVIDALLPSTQSSSYSCLIANALHFSCMVAPLTDRSEQGLSTHRSGAWVWGMFLPDNMYYTRAKAIADAVDCELIERHGQFVVLLPEPIGNAADAFDEGLAFHAYLG